MEVRDLTPEQMAQRLTEQRNLIEKQRALIVCLKAEKKQYVTAWHSLYASYRQSIDDRSQLFAELVAALNKE